MRIIGWVMRLLRRRRGAGEPDVDNVRLLQEMSPDQRVWLVQVLISAGGLAASSPVELAVPAVRLLARRRGVQAGAALGTLLSFLVTQAYGVLVRRQVLAGEASGNTADDDRWYDRWMTRVVFSGTVVLPAAGAVLPGTIVARTRSPLWGLGLWVAVRLVAVTVLAADASRLKAHRTGDEPAPEEH